MWRNIQLLFIDTHICTHWFIDDDDDAADDDDDNDSVATKKDYIKDTNSYINIYIGLHIYMCVCICIGKRNTSSELVVIECCVITTI